MSRPSLGFFQRLILILLHTLVIVVPFAFTWVNEELFEFNKMIITYALAVMIGGAWAMRMVVEQRIIFKRTLFDIPLALFLTSQVLSTVFSIHPYTSVFGYYTRFHGGLLSTITYYLLYYALVSNVPKQHIPRLILSASLAAFGVSLYAIPEHFGHSPSCALITSGQTFDASCWVQDVKSRVFATFGQPNWLAAYAITLIPIQWALILDPTSKKSSFTKGFLGLTSLVLFATLLFTQSRSGQLGLALGLLVFGAGVGYLWLQKRLSLTTSLPLVGGLMAGVILLAAIFGTSYSPSFSSLIQSRQPETAPTESAPNQAPQPVVNRLDEGGTSSGEIRKIVWSGALKVAQRYPLFGSGVETFAYSYYLDRPMAHNLVSEWDFLYNKAHNEFLNFLATTGVFGLGTYCLVLGWFMVKAGQRAVSAKTPPATALLMVGLMAGVTALTVSNFFGFSTVMVTILLFFSLAFVEMVGTESDEKAESNLRARLAVLQLGSGSYMGLVMIGLVGLYLLWSVSTMWTADHAFTKGKQYLQSGYTQDGLEFLLGAIRQSPQEALYYDELASTYAAIAVSLANQGDATSASQLAQSALATSDQTLQLNPRHLNFHKSRARIFITLAELNPAFLNQATTALEQALSLSPTDAKLMYNLGLVQIARGDTANGFVSIQKSVEMKPNYEAARFELGKQLETQGKLNEAQSEYHYILEKIAPHNQQVKDRLTIVEASLSAQKR